MDIGITFYTFPTIVTRKRIPASAFILGRIVNPFLEVLVECICVIYITAEQLYREIMCI